MAMKKMFQRLSEKFFNLDIRNKLLMSFIVLITVPLLIGVFQSYSVSRRIIERKTSQYSHDILYQTSKTLEARLEKLEDISFSIVFNNEIQRDITNKNIEQMDSFERHALSSEIEGILSSHVLYHDEINAIYLVSFAGQVYELDKTKQKYGILEDYLAAIKEGAGGVVWIGALDKKEVVAMTRVVNSTRSQLPVAYLVVYVEKSFLQELIESTYSIESGTIQIIDKQGYVVSDADKSQIGQKLNYDGFVKNSEYSFYKQKANGQEQYVAMSEPMHNGWRIVTTVPVSVYQAEVLNLRSVIIALSFLLLLAAALSAIGLSNTISNPIRKLSKTMISLGKGNLSVRCDVQSVDEIGKLSATFNQMADNIEELIQKVYDEQIMKRDAELRSLQMQINPHFLYNTLETINWMARYAGNEEIGIMAKSLGDLMRATINSRSYVLLKEEMDSLKNYLKIQEYRYSDKFNVQFEIDEKSEKYYVPKLIIQPIVENAIYHGIEPSFENGTIIIKSIVDENKLIISVSDDGVGIPFEMITALLDVTKEQKTEEPYSIGIQNVIKRIKTLFGNHYGIRIKSELGEGTVIYIDLPIIEDVSDIREEILNEKTNT